MTIEYSIVAHMMWARGIKKWVHVVLKDTEGKASNVMVRQGLKKKEGEGGDSFS